MSKLPVSSLAINDERASHRIVGTSELFGNGILGYYTRDMVGDALRSIREVDASADVHVEPHNPVLMGKALRSTDVEWIVNSEGELGVKIGDQFFFMYKGESFMYPSKRDEMKYRHVEKREFGESGPKATDDDFLKIGEWREIITESANNEMAYFN